MIRSQKGRDRSSVIPNNDHVGSVVGTENDGHQHFTEHDLASNPTHLPTLETGDFDRDGEADFVTGGMHLCPPYDRMGRVTLWPNWWAETKAGAQTRPS